MSVHLVGDNISRLSTLRATLAPQFSVDIELLRDARLDRSDTHAVVVLVDLNNVDNIAAMKQLSPKLQRLGRRIFLADPDRLLIARAYALGATHVLTNPAELRRLLVALSGNAISPAGGLREAARSGAEGISAMFGAVRSGSRIDVTATRDAGKKIAVSIAERGLKNWLATVRRHHEGTYQHCLLVTGVAVDFGLTLGMGDRDIERLYTAAMFHDIGKARIPLAVLDKPGLLDPRERAQVETHPVAGYEILKHTAGISSEVLDGVRHHHEYLDGSGYPDGLSAPNISDLVRMLTICDVFAALIERRTYKTTRSREQAYEIITRMSGKLEKPLVEAFREVALSR